MFCDDYNPSNKTYCKRLRVLCPEHCKDPKIGDNEVCGCPLVTNVFSPTGNFCRAPKKNCTKHYVWEKLRRAEVRYSKIIISYFYYCSNNELHNIQVLFGKQKLQNYQILRNYFFIGFFKSSCILRKFQTYQ